MSCHPSASVQADSKTRTAKASRGNHKYGKPRDTPEDHSPMGIASEGQAADSRAGSGVCEEGDRAERTSAQPLAIATHRQVTTALSEISLWPLDQALDSNRYGKGDLAIYGNALIPAMKHLFTPIAGESIFIKVHGRTSMVCGYGSPGERCIRFRRSGASRFCKRTRSDLPVGASRFCKRTRSDLPVLMNGMLLQ